MKKTTIIFVLLLSCGAKGNLFDFRLSSAGASPKYTFIHNGQNWQGFVQVGSGYMLWEAGPRINLTKNINLTGRIGANFSYGNNDLTINPQFALVIFAHWKNWQLFSINEYTNEYTTVKGTEYYYEHDLSYKNTDIHLEAVYQDGSYKPFFGPTISFPLKKGNIFF